MILDKITAKKNQKIFLSAVKTELRELQFRVCMNGFLLVQKYGDINRTYLEQVKVIFASYEGDEKVESVMRLIEGLLTSTDEQFERLASAMKSEEGIGVSLKTFPSIFLDFNLGEVSKLPLEHQRKIYEFKNTLHVLNEEIEVAKSYHARTFDSALNEVNHQILSRDLKQKYNDIHEMCTRVCRKAHVILESEIT